MRSQSAGHHDNDIVRQMRKSNYYDILDVKENATEAEIKKSFKQMALKYHPDKNSATYSKQVFHKISEAYDTLSDASKRDAYDRKQNLFKIPQEEFIFRKSTMFFYQAPSFNNFNHRHFYEHSDYQRRKAAEERMEDRARHERQKFKRQHNQKYKFSAYSFSKEENSNSNKKGSAEANQKSKTDFSFKKEWNNFKFQRDTSKQSSKDQQQIEEKRRERERKLRLQKQREISQNNLKYFFLMVLMVGAWIAFDNFGGAMRGVQVYSMNPSEYHKISKLTKELNTTFYVTEDYVQRAAEDDKFREHVDRKIDTAYIKHLSRMCNSMQAKQTNLNTLLGSVKSAKSREKIQEQLQSLEFSSCTNLHLIRERNPIYFKSLFVNTAARYEF